MMIVKTRHRQSTSWTSFDTSPFFGIVAKSITDKTDPMFEWPTPASLMSSQDVQTGQARNKQSMKSVGTSTTGVSSSTWASSSTAKNGKGGTCHDPNVAEELQIEISQYMQDHSSPAPQRVTGSATGRPHQGRATDQNNHAEKCEEKVNDPYQDDNNDDDSDSESSNEFEIFGGPKRRTTRRPRRVQYRDACMAFALEDIREFATTSVNKAKVAWTQVQKMFHQQLDPEDEDQTRKRLARKMSAHPTTVFVVPKSSPSKPRDHFSLALESLADSLTNPTALEDDGGETLELRTQADDLSSLTDPPFLDSKPLPPLFRMRGAGNIFPRNREKADFQHRRPTQLNFDENGDEYIEFEPENVEVDLDGGLFNDRLDSSRVATEIKHSAPPEKPLSEVSEPSLSDRFRMFLPHLIPHPKQSISKANLLPSKVQLVWGAKVPRPGNVRAKKPVVLQTTDHGSVYC